MSGHQHGSRLSGSGYNLRPNSNDPFSIAETHWPQPPASPISHSKHRDSNVEKSGFTDRRGIKVSQQVIHESKEINKEIESALIVYIAEGELRPNFM